MGRGRYSKIGFLAQTGGKDSSEDKALAIRKVLRINKEFISRKYIIERELENAIMQARGRRKDQNLCTYNENHAITSW